MFCFSLHFQKKQRLEWKSTQEVAISSPRIVCKGKYFIFFHGESMVIFVFLMLLFLVVVCRRQQWLLRGFWRLWTEQWINRWRKKLTWSMASELIAMSKGWHMIVHELTDPMPYLFIALENHNYNHLHSSISSFGSTMSHILAGINKIMLSLT